MNLIKNNSHLQALFFFAAIVGALAGEVVPVPERYPPGVDPILCPGNFSIFH